MKINFIPEEHFLAYLSEIIDLALKEDIGSGDHTTLSCIKPDSVSKVQLLVKDEGIIAGVDLAEIILQKLDPKIQFEKIIEDGEKVKYGDVVFRATGKTRALLTGERTVLNFMQRLSGISTKTYQFVSKLKTTNCKLLDTRKTTPGLRLLEKWAVSIGGGYNHRIGLYDMILIKDNHIDSSGGITNAVNSVKQYLKLNHLDLKIEVEIRNFQELEELLTLPGIDRVLIDNFNPENLSKAVKMIGKKIETEASGKIDESNIIAYAETGVDYLSSGSLTYSVRALDLSLKIITPDR